MNALDVSAAVAIRNLMILAGSLIMVLNIIRYRKYELYASEMKSMKVSRSALALPRFLLILFLVGYIAIGLLGQPDLIVASILLGGSIFVYLIVRVMWIITRQIRGNEERLETRYDGLRRDLQSLTQDSLAVFRINLTKDLIEERSGEDLFDTDQMAVRYTDLFEQRKKYLVMRVQPSEHTSDFSRENLIREFRLGHTQLSETLFMDRRDNKSCFVRLDVSMVLQPGSGDIAAFITESRCDSDIIASAIEDSVLEEQYDMVAYLTRGDYTVVTTNCRGDMNGCVLPKGDHGRYSDFIKIHLLPILDAPQEEKAQITNELELTQIRTHAKKNGAVSVDCPCRTPDGHVFYKRFSFYLVMPELDFYLLLVSDITEPVREQIMRNEQLSEALAQAEQASAAKTAFLSNMSHDIRTPMNAIIGYIHLAMQQQDIPPVTREYLTKIDTSSQHLLSLINDILEMSRIESGKMQLNERPEHLGALMTEMCDMFEAQMDQNGIRYEVTTDVIHDYVLCDKQRLSRIFLNLLSNALKFTPEGGSVCASLRELTEEDSPLQGMPDTAAYEIRVSDTGIGMSEEFAQRVFDAFERERTSTVSGIQGTGLGMAITKRIVDLMGGSIILNTAPGKGSEFIIALRFPVLEEDITAADADTGCGCTAGGADPSAAAAQAGAVGTADRESAGTGMAEAGASGSAGRTAPAAGAEGGLSGAGRPVSLEGKRALLTEDMVINREIALQILGNMGLVVDTAENGQEAVDRILQGTPYDVVLMDIQMPVMDGYEAARRIRALPDPATRNIPIIAMTANAFQEDVLKAEAAGMNAHVAKPIDPALLKKTLCEVLCREQTV